MFYPALTLCEGKKYMKNEEIKKEFIKLFGTLTARHSKAEVWFDFVEMSACAISNVCDKKFFDIREQMYLSCTKKYSAGELDNLATLLSYVIMAFECNPEQDFLGEMFGVLKFLTIGKVNISHRIILADLWEI